jgi:hypothetical protein
VKEAFYHILKHISEKDLSTSAAASARDDNTPTSKTANQPIFHPIIPSPEIYGYRNKVEFSWGKYISARE